MKNYYMITGAAGGLGKAFAVECASRGWNLFLTDLSEEALSALASGLESTYGIEVLYHTCDLTDQASRASLMQETANNRLRFQGLINVAGLDYEGYFTERTNDQIRTLIRLNIEATVDMTYEILKRRVEGETFRIITVSSLAAFYPMPVKAMYAASKRFLLNFFLALREELRSEGVTVTILCPAGMPTNRECIDSLDAQGFLGRITAKNVGYVAASTVEKALKGKAVYIPGVLNRVLKVLGTMVSPSLVAYLIGRRWGSVRENRNLETA